MKDTLYYDGRCSLCAREVARLRECNNGGLELRDIHEVDEGDLPPRDTLLRELHLQKADGDMLVGIDANVAAWQHTGYGILLRWMAWPGIRALTSRVYAFWARRRYQRLYGRL